MNRVVGATLDHCSCGWPVPRNFVIASDTPEFIPDDVEITYECPRCGLGRVTAFVRNHDEKPKS